MKYTFAIYAIVAFLVIVLLVIFRLGPYESPEDFLLATVLLDDTAYAAKYSEWRFREIKLGDTKRHVLESIGEPLVKKTYPPDKTDDTQEYWWYSRSPSSTNYHQRFIVFSSKGVVVGITRQFYVD